MSEAYRTDNSSARPRLKRLRFLAILAATLLLGLVSFVFGIFIAVASDLPSLQHFAELGDARSTELLDDRGRPIGLLAENNRAIVRPDQKETEDISSGLHSHHPKPSPYPPVDVQLMRPLITPVCALSLGFGNSTRRPVRSL
jgi:hypothetical protein